MVQLRIDRMLVARNRQAAALLHICRVIDRGVIGDAKATPDAAPPAGFPAERRGLVPALSLLAAEQERIADGLEKAAGRLSDLFSG